MADDLPGRRDLFRWAAGGVAGFTLSGHAAAQVTDPLGRLKLPPELMALLPKKQLDLARTVALLLQVERSADARGLPRSALAFRPAMTMRMSEDSLYQQALPRLVSLIDRSEDADVGISDQAGEILADLNATQREVPDALKPVVAEPPPGLPSRSHDYETLKPEYAALFASAQLRPEFADFTDWHLRAIRQFRPRYEKVGMEMGVPWYFIGAIHGLESSFNFRAHLHNGDFPLRSRTRQVPSGRPTIWLPPSDWESSARDALRVLGFTGKSDWTLERTLYRLEAFNGFDYRWRSVPTPYLWCFSNHYDRGKFVRDGRWDPNARSQQCGAATVLRMMVDAKEIELPTG